MTTINAIVLKYTSVATINNDDEYDTHMITH